MMGWLRRIHCHPGQGGDYCLLEATDSKHITYCPVLLSSRWEARAGVAPGGGGDVNPSQARRKAP